MLTSKDAAVVFVHRIGEDPLGLRDLLPTHTRSLECVLMSGVVFFFFFCARVCLWESLDVVMSAFSGSIGEVLQ